MTRLRVRLQLRFEAPNAIASVGHNWQYIAIIATLSSFYFLWWDARLMFSRSETFDTTWCSFSQGTCIHAYFNLNMLSALGSLRPLTRDFVPGPDAVLGSSQAAGSQSQFVQAPVSLYRFSFRTTPVNRQLSANFLLTWKLGPYCTFAT